MERQSSVVSGVSQATDEDGLGSQSHSHQELNIIPEEDSQIDANSSHRSKQQSEHDQKSQHARSRQESVDVNTASQ